ncbi:hypothetical protein GOP47_0008767 [Adiantum capillus-veneris]|uniref:Xylanase inhibitor C-terminal domain-containing protein n=1 Tax=Adiantum capillus-veneris TaxID=13818 RepID=A0A9D4ZK13_ADICA|nr:hypothetical protein GOP47_0008767 [Adiantum capillus-veneris]
MVPLVGISIEGRRLSTLVDASSFTTLDTDTIGLDTGTILDTGTVLTTLIPAAYRIVGDAFRAATEARRLIQESVIDPEDICYQLDISQEPTIDNTPSVELHFEGNANIVLPPKNVLSTSLSLQKFGIATLVYEKNRTYSRCSYLTLQPSLK